MCQISCWWYRRIDNHEVGSCWFLCFLQFGEEENIVFLCSGKCDTTNLFKVQTLKVGNQLENSLLFYPLEQSCDIRGQTFDIHAAKKTTNHISKQQSFTNLSFHKRFFVTWRLKVWMKTRLSPFHLLEEFHVFFLSPEKIFSMGLNSFHSFLVWACGCSVREERCHLLLLSLLCSSRGSQTPWWTGSVLC